MSDLNPVLRRAIERLAHGDSPLHARAEHLLVQWRNPPEHAADWLNLQLRSERLAKIAAAGKEYDETLTNQLLNHIEPYDWQAMQPLPAPVAAQKKLGEVMFNSVMQPTPADERAVRFRIDCMSLGRWPTERATELALERGYPIDVVRDDYAFDTALVNALSAEQTEKLAAFYSARTEDVTHNMRCREVLPSAISKGRDSQKFKLLDGAYKAYNVRRMSDQVRWGLTVMPTEEEARLDDMPYADYLTLFLEAADQPWPEVKAAQAKLIHAFNSGEDLHITNSDGTDIRMKLTGHTFANSVIQRNIPGSEIFSGPVRESVQGRIVAKGTFCMNIAGDSKVMHDLDLTFENGVITRGTAREGQEALDEILSLHDNLPPTDPKYQGMRMAGEIGIGTNPHITRHLANPLLVEKISGSFHVALGNAYGNRYMGEDVFMDNGNRADEHWDLTTMLRGKQGEMYLDGHLMQKDGVWQAVPELGITTDDVRVLNEGWRALPNAQQPKYWREKFAAEEKQISR